MSLTNSTAVRYYIAAGSALVVSAVPAVALAAGDGEGLVLKAVWHAINLAVLIGLVIYFGRKMISKVLRERRDKLMAELDEAARLKDEAKSMLEQYEARLGKLDTERDAILDDYRKMGETERDRIIEDAKKQAEKIARDAEQTVEREVAKARATLEAEVLSLAAKLAEEAVVSRLDDKRHKALVDGYVEDLQKSYVGAPAAGGK